MDKLPVEIAPRNIVNQSVVAQGAEFGKVCCVLIVVASDYTLGCDIIGEGDDASEQLAESLCRSVGAGINIIAVNLPVALCFAEQQGQHSSGQIQRC